MKSTRLKSMHYILTILLSGASTTVFGQSVALYAAEDIFPLVSEHVHGSTVVELRDGSLLAAWFQGSGERWADDVRIVGARLEKGSVAWSTPFLMADTPAFPDINPVLFLDGDQRLWLVWYTVVANQWETSLLKYRIAEDYGSEGSPPVWIWQDVLHVKPGGLTERGIQPGDRFVASVERQVDSLSAWLQDTGALEDDVMRQRWESRADRIRVLARGDDHRRSGRLYQQDGTAVPQEMGYPYFRRMGWQSKNKPFLTDSGTIILPLYSDGFSFSLMAITADGGRTWQFSEPLVGLGNIQASIAAGPDSVLTAYMRDNGPPPQRLMTSRSIDGGRTWSLTRDSDLPNPGAGTDIVTLQSGNWALAYNDTEDGRHSLAISISDDYGATWKWTRHLELDSRPEGATTGHYPAIIQGADGRIHVTYSYHHGDRDGAPHKTVRYAVFTEEWVKEGD